jgi:dTDP-4-amino-4,6-dideoxygalactose transaminase
MTNMQACVALAQLERIDEIHAKRKQIQAGYDEDLQSYAIERPENSVLWMYDIRTVDRDSMMNFLRKNGIETRVFFKPMSMQPMYRAPYEHLNAFYQSKVGMYLPTYTSMTRADVKYITNKIKEYEGKH